MKNKKFWWLGGLVALAVIAGCTGLGNHDKSPRVTAIEIPRDTTDKKQYPPQCDASCQKIWDEMSAEERIAHLITQVEVSDSEIAWQTRRADALMASAASASQGSSSIMRSQARATKVPLPAPALPASSPAATSGPSTSPVVIPVFPARKASVVKSLDGFDTFGYRKGELVYSPWWGGDKKVSMTEQVTTFRYQCTRLISGTQHVATIRVTTAVSPSLIWEADYHRLVAIYGAVGTKGGNKDVVNGEDVIFGASTYLGQYQEMLCEMIARKSLADILIDPSAGLASGLGNLIRQDASAPWEMKIQTVRVELPDELLRALALKGIEPAPKAVTPPCGPAPKKPIPICTRK